MDDSMAALPPRSEFLYKGFAWYANRMVRKTFEALAVDDSELHGTPIPLDVPVIVFANHPSWWDPILAVLVHESTFIDRAFYAPIDADALKKYEVFRKLGFYPTQMNSHRGAASFLKSSRAILNSGKAALWVTPEGSFADVRDLERPLMPGLAHLVSNAEKVVVVSCAMEYAFLNERRPYMFGRLSKPMFRDAFGAIGKKELTAQLSDILRTNQKQLSEMVIARDLQPFRLVKQSMRRPNNFYDIARVVKSIFRRESVQLRHGD